MKSLALLKMLLIVIIIIYSNVLITNSCYSEQFTATLQDTLPEKGDIREDYNTDFAVSLEKIHLKNLPVEGVVGPFCAAISSDGSKIAYAVQVAKDKWSISIDGRNGPGYDSVSFPVFSLDGSKLAYAAKSENDWFTVIREEGQEKEGPKFEGVSCPVFSADGSKLAYAVKQGNKWFVMLNDKKGPEFDSVYSQLAFSLDGSKLAYAVQDNDRSYIIVNDQKGPEFDLVACPTFGTGDKLAYFAVLDKQNMKVCVVLNDQKGPVFDGVVGDIVFSSDGKNLAFIAYKEDRDYEGFVITLRVNDDSSLTLHNTFGPLNIHVVRVTPLTNAHITGTGWSPMLNSDGSMVIYGINGGPHSFIEAPLRTSLPGKYYYINNIKGDSTVVVNGNVVANINDIGLITPFTFNSESKEISWMVLSKEKGLYLRKLKLK